MVKQQLISCFSILYLSFGLVHCIWPEFYHYTRTKTSGVYYNYGSIIPASDNYDRTKPTFFVIHGYGNNGNASWVISTKNELLKKLDANVFIVNWSEAATSALTYLVVIQNVQPCGNRIGAFISQNNIPANKIYCIGHSLGAHICGFLGKSLKPQNLLARITASPGYTGDSGSRLDKSDASYVDVIHTNAGLLGLPTAIGHKDFYPNGGSTQPGCGVFDSTCSHQRSTLFFVESINSNCHFKSTSCGATYYSIFPCTGPDGFMGYTSNSTNNVGAFKLATNPGTPFCRG